MITYDGDITGQALQSLIQKNAEDKDRFERNKKYYLGEQEITQADSDAVPNHKTVCNHAKDISDTASSYFLGNPITYKVAEESEEFKKLQDALIEATTSDDDQENALSLSIYGRTYEYIYVEEGENTLRVKPIDPQTAFIVYDTTIEHHERFGVYYYDTDETTEALAMTDEEIIYFSDWEETKREQHHLGYIPIVEYKNNKFDVGDFEQQIGLIDAYNTMTADRVADKEQFIDAILVLYGAILGDTDEETDEALTNVRKRKLLEMPDGASASYLTRQLDEGGMETLRNALKEDIYTFSHVPNLTDVQFSGNSSGVAMEYKLLGLEMLTKTKERWYRRGLRKRLNIFLHYLGMIGENSLKEADIEIVFSRSLPKNLVELAGIVTQLAGKVSDETLLALLPFVENPLDEIKKVEEKQREAENRALQAQAQLMQQQEQQSTGEEEAEDEVQSNEEVR